MVLAVVLLTLKYWLALVLVMVTLVAADMAPAGDAGAILLVPILAFVGCFCVNYILSDLAARLFKGRVLSDGAPQGMPYRVLGLAFLGLVVYGIAALVSAPLNAGYLTGSNPLYLPVMFVVSFVGMAFLSYWLVFSKLPGFGSTWKAALLFGVLSNPVWLSLSYLPVLAIVALSPILFLVYGYFSYYRKWEWLPLAIVVVFGIVLVVLSGVFFPPTPNHYNLAPDRLMNSVLSTQMFAGYGCSAPQGVTFRRGTVIFAKQVRGSIVDLVDSDVLSFTVDPALAGITADPVNGTFVQDAKLVVGSTASPQTNAFMVVCADAQNTQKFVNVCIGPSETSPTITGCAPV